MQVLELGVDHTAAQHKPAAPGGARSRRPPRPAIAEEHLAHVAERVGDYADAMLVVLAERFGARQCSRSTGRTSPSTVWGGPAFGFSRV